MKKSIKKRIFILTVIFLFSFTSFALAKRCQNDDDCQKLEPGKPRTIKCINERCVRTVELIYPNIGGQELTIDTVKEGLPKFVKYMFYFSVGIIGLVIFGVMVSSGMKYLVSVGDPNKMADARSGIYNAFLGAIILFSSIYIFNKINPQLVVFELEETKTLGEPLVAGIYVCEKGVNTSNILTALNNYISSAKSGNYAEMNNNALILKNAMWDDKVKKGCYRINFSGNLKFPIDENSFIFTIPYLEIDFQNAENSKEIYEYGLILHENDNWRGKCAILGFKGDLGTVSPGPGGGGAFGVQTGVLGESTQLYKKYCGFLSEYIDTKGPFRSVTVFRKNEIPSPLVILYEGQNYNRNIEAVPEEGSGNLQNLKEEKIAISGNADIEKKQLSVLTDNARSIHFSPAGGLIAILQTTNLPEICYVFTNDNPNLIDVLEYKGRCNWYAYLPWNWLELFQECHPLVDTVILIKGTPL